MMARRNESSKKRVCGGMAAAWLLVPLFVLVVLKADCLPQVTRLRDTSITRVSDYFFSIRSYGQDPIAKNSGVTSKQVQYPAGAAKENVVQSVTQVSDETVDKVSPSGSESEKLTAKVNAADGTPKTEDSVTGAPPSHSPSNDGVDVDAIEDLKHEKEVLAMDGERDGSLRNSDVAAARSKLSCSFSSPRMDLCAMEGDVRMHGKSATVYVVAASDDSYRPANGTTVKIHPYARKWEERTMQMVREVTIRSSAADDAAAPPPRCTVTHDVPAVVFSTTSAYSKNFFHAIDDTIIPLYNTAREYDGHVQLVATDYNRDWISQYRHVLAALSVYPVIDFDADDAVRCFPSVRVGVQSHDELRINPALSRKGYTMVDFRDFLRSAYSLKHAWAAPVSRSSGRKPRLVMVLRRRSRAITNEAEAIAAAAEAGFEVVAAGPEMVRDLARFAEVLNSCTVMVGVHGAGLTNMVFLPHNGTVMQIVPCCGMKELCWHEFGRPAPDMGLRYVEYEVTDEETTLKEAYPRDHAVFTDPQSIHKQGFIKVWSIFLNGQNVTLDIGRFRAAMQQMYQSVTIT